MKRKTGIRILKLGIMFAVGALMLKLKEATVQSIAMLRPDEQRDSYGNRSLHEMRISERLNTTHTDISKTSENRTIQASAEDFNQHKDKASSTVPEKVIICSQEQRKQYLRHACAERNRKCDRYFDERPHMLTDLKHNLSYCFIYKAGSTSWIQTLIVANGGKSRDNVLKGQKISPIGGSAHFPTIQKKAHLQNIHYNSTVHDELTKFIVVRHPFDRLLSAYYQKIAIDVDNWFRPFRNVLKQFYRHSNTTEVNDPSSYKKSAFSKDAKYQSVSFSEFIDYVIDDYYGKFKSGMIQKGHKEHYVSYFPICDPCNIEYDYILRTETNNEDAHNILDILHLEDDFMDELSFNTAPQRTSTTGSRKHLPEFETLSDYQIQELSQIYKLDLELFGYGLDKESKTTYCMLENESCC